MIYYKKFDEPVKFTETINGHTYDRVIDGEWVSDDPNVDKIWFTGSTTADLDSSVCLRIHVVLKDGQRFEETNLCIKDNFALEKLTAAADIWLNTLKQNTVERLNKVTQAAYKVASNIAMWMSHEEWLKLPIMYYDPVSYDFIVANGIVIHNNKGDAAYCRGGNFFRRKYKP